MSKRLTGEELQEIRDRAKKATEAPWGVDVPIEVCSECKYEYEIVESSVFLAPIVAESKRGEDAAFIAHAREDIPKLLAEIECMKKDRKIFDNTFRNIDALIDEHRLVNNRSANGLADEIVELISELERKVGDIT